MRLQEGVTKRTADPDQKRACFFAIAKRLPLELQMLLVHRVYDSKDSVLTKDSEERKKEQICQEGNTGGANDGDTPFFQVLTESWRCELDQHGIAVK